MFHAKPDIAGFNLYFHSINLSSMNFKNYPFLLLLCLPSLFSCVAHRYVYSAPTPNVCYFKENGDSKLAAYYYEGGGGNSGNNVVGFKNQGYDVQGGYAFNNKMAITANYSYRSERDSSYNNYDALENKSLVRYIRNQFEIGLASFKFDKNKKGTTNLAFGFGAGKYKIVEQGTDFDQVTNTLKAYGREITMPFYKLYIQPSYNYVDNSYFRFSAGAKANFMYFSNQAGNYLHEEESYWGFDRLNNKLVIFFEPNFNLQAGLPQYNWIRFEMNLSFILFDLNFPGETLMKKRSGGVSLGLTFDPVAAFRKSSGNK